jgi:UDP-N-acetylglucosamine 1-carboxyvinyltransferase
LEKFIIHGGTKLSGKVRVSGAKNAALPILASTILNNNISELENIPNLRDVNMMLRILEILGIGTDYNPVTKKLKLDSSSIKTHKVPPELMREMRSSIFLMGPLLSRLGQVIISYPGGCEIGHRPIDLHLKGLRTLGAEIIEEGGFIIAKGDEMRGCDIHLDYPSVGATENIMMAAISAMGQTTIRNAAKEPEILDLQSILNKMGADVSGAGTDIIRIKGTSTLKPVKHSIISDRIVAGTLLGAGAITGGDVTVENVIPEHIEPILAKFREAGCNIIIENDKIHLKAPDRLKAIDTIRTLPHPGFPTDMQAQIMACMAVADGTTIITETVFENRFKHSDELRRMGAYIKVNGRSAVVKGVKNLTGTIVEGKDLRAGAALILAGLSAKGITIVEGVTHVDRGYDKIEEMLIELGAQISRTKAD